MSINRAVQPVILWLENVDSTMNAACKAAGHQALPFWLAARHQHLGRGTKGRRWFDDPGNLKATFMVHPQRPQKDWPQLSLAAALALRDALAAFVPSSKALTLKWPNDVLLHGRKLAGILLETVPLHGHSVLAIGFGVNLAAHPKADDLRVGGWPVTDLRHETGSTTEPQAFLARLGLAMARRLAAWEQESTSIRTDWMAQAHGLGMAVTLQTGKDCVEGLFQGIDKKGHIVLQTSWGLQSYPSAEIVWHRETPHSI